MESTHGDRTEGGSFSQLGERAGSRAINVPHLLNLGGSLFDIVLVDTYGVNPERPVSKASSLAVPTPETQLPQELV
jgi:hypothetical protein